VDEGGISAGRQLIFNMKETLDLIID